MFILNIENSTKEHYMATDLFMGRCEDCYELFEKPASLYQHPKMPRALLCQRCFGLRALPSKNQTPIGLPALGKWVNAGKLVITETGDKKRPIIVKVKYLPGDPEGEMKRVHFPGNPKWLPGGVFGHGKQVALMEAGSFMRIFYFKNMQYRCEIVPD